MSQKIPGVSPSDSCALARSFLSRVRRQKEEIDSRTFRLKAVQSLASKVTSSLTKAPVVRSLNPSVMDDSVARIMEAEKNLADALVDFLDVMDEVTDVLELVQDSDCRKVLEKHYLDLKSFLDISVEMDRTRRWVTELNNRGLMNVQRILEEKGWSEA